MAYDIESLAAYRELDDLLYKTVMALDVGDWDAYRASFAPDTTFSIPEHVRLSGGPSLLDLSQFVQLAREALHGLDAVQHRISNMVHILNGPSARTS